MEAKLFHLGEIRAEGVLCAQNLRVCISGTKKPPAAAATGGWQAPSGWYSKLRRPSFYGAAEREG